MKFTKEMTTKLIKYVSKCDVSFNPFDVRSTPAKEVLQIMSSIRLAKSNPKFQLKRNVVATPYPPVIEFAFVDDSKKTIQIQYPKQYAHTIIQEVWQHAREIDFEYQMNDKDIESM